MFCMLCPIIQYMSLSSWQVSEDIHDDVFFDFSPPTRRRDFSQAQPLPRIDSVASDRENAAATMVRPEGLRESMSLPGFMGRQVNDALDRAEEEEEKRQRQKRHKEEDEEEDGEIIKCIRALSLMDLCVSVSCGLLQSKLLFGKVPLEQSMLPAVTSG